MAERRGVAFRDTDADVEKQAGMAIADIFIDMGEQRFRTLERVAVAAALSEHEGVLALGGGAVLDEATRATLRDQTVVFLDVDPATAAARVGFNRDRPLLLGNPRHRLAELLTERRPLYEEVSSITVSTAERTPEQVAEVILEWLP